MHRRTFLKSATMTAAALVTTVPAAPFNPPDEPTLFIADGQEYGRTFPAQLSASREACESRSGGGKLNVGTVAFTPADSPRRFRVVEVSHPDETDCLIEPPEMDGLCDYEQYVDASVVYERADAFRVAAERNAAGGYVGWFCVVELGKSVTWPMAYATLAASGLGVEEMAVQTPIRLAVPTEAERAAYRLVMCEG